jgi:hypothetical protein
VDYVITALAVQTLPYSAHHRRKGCMIFLFPTQSIVIEIISVGYLAEGYTAGKPPCRHTLYAVTLSLSFGQIVSSGRDPRQIVA